MANGAREQLDDSFLDEYDHSPPEGMPRKPRLPAQTEFRIIFP